MASSCCLALPCVKGELLETEPRTEGVPLQGRWRQRLPQRMQSKLFPAHIMHWKILYFSLKKVHINRGFGATLWIDTTEKCFTSSSHKRLLQLVFFTPGGQALFPRGKTIWHVNCVNVSSGGAKVVKS